MTRPTLTLWLAGVLAVVLLAVGLAAHVPYVELSPGPATNTLGNYKGYTILAVRGAKTYRTNGELDLTTVSLRDQLTLFEALEGWVSNRKAIIPREFIYPDNQSEQQNEAETKAEMTDSQNNATGAALTELGLARIRVESVAKGTGSVGKLQAGDIITAVNGVKVYGPGPLRAQVRKHRIGDVLTVSFVRAGKPGQVQITTGPSSDKPAKAALGVNTQVDSDVKVDISLADVGGPSAGLMFALGIIDKLGPDSLTGGKHIAGTGTIEIDGTVGPIGGIAEKLLGARDVGATVFLVPDANCHEARAHRPDGLTLVRVRTLKDALSSLAAVRAGRKAPSC